MNGISLALGGVGMLTTGGGPIGARPDGETGARSISA
jgi:hypothetical protein